MAADGLANTDCAGSVGVAGFGQGGWVTELRNPSRGRRLSAAHRRQIEQLPGWTWESPQQRVSWAQFYKALAGFAGREGHANPPPDYRTDDGLALGQWVTAQRRRHRGRKPLSVQSRAKLAALPGWVWDDAPSRPPGTAERGGRPTSRAPQTSRWDDTADALEAFAAEHGHCQVPADLVDRHGVAVGRWADQQRALHRRGRLSAVRAARLQALPGWSWALTAADDGFADWLADLHAYADQYGAATPPQHYRTDDGRALGQWGGPAAPRVSDRDAGGAAHRRVGEHPGLGVARVRGPVGEGFRRIAPPRRGARFVGGAAPGDVGLGVQRGAVG